MEVARKSGKPTIDIIRVLESMTPEQYALVNKMVKDELEYRILNGSPEMRRLDTVMQVRANLKKTY
jgi:hypothetical protein